MSEQTPTGPTPVEQGAPRPATRPLVPLEADGPVALVQGGEPAPWMLWIGAILVLMAAMVYVGLYFGEFSGRAHLLDQPVAADSSTTGAPVAAIDGGQVYTKLCVACHQATGLGMAGAFPPLVGSDWVTGSKARVIRILLHGLGGPVDVNGTTYNGAMPAWKTQLSHEEIAAVLTHIRSSWGNSADAVTAAEVAAIDQQVGARVEPWTAEELMKVAGDSTVAPAAAPTATADSAAQGR